MYNADQIKDIQEREAKALEMLKELQLTPSCQMQYVNVGNDTFATKLTPYLQDFKYKDVISPIQKDDINPKTTE